MSRPELAVNFFTPEAIQDPYPLYEQVRAVGDIVWNPVMQCWITVGYDVSRDVLSDGGERFLILSGDPELTFWFEAPNVITVDGEHHRRLRGALYPLFTRQAVARWETRVRQVVDDMLAPLVAGADRVELMSDLTTLPTVIVADLLGVPQERYDDMHRWSDTIAGNLSFGMEDEATRAKMRTASDEINTYLREEMQRHRREQPADLMTTMLQFADKGLMTEDEVRSTGVLLLIAAYHTTSKTMANTLIALEKNPHQLDLVVRDLDLVPAAIEEAMRWYGTVQTIPRQAVRDVTVGGVDVAAGENVFVMIAGANRDPGRWPEPGKFDVGRKPVTHLGFGYGSHLCLGAALARIEVRVAIQRLLEIAPRYRLRDVDFGHSFNIRGPERGAVEVIASGEPAAAH
jgi:cytochrome P450